MNLMMFILPAMAVVLLSLPLVKMFTSKVSKESAKWRLMTHIGGFFGAVALTLCLSMGSAFAAEGASILSCCISYWMFCIRCRYCRCGCCSCCYWSFL